jgi:hypothetical protein
MRYYVIMSEADAQQSATTLGTKKRRNRKRRNQGEDLDIDQADEEEAVGRESDTNEQDDSR